MEYAAFGFATLTWWTYLILLVVVFTSVYGAWILVTWQEQRGERAAGPRPCLEHMGTDMGQVHDHWCWLIDGHEGQHINQWGVPQEDFTSEEDYVNTDEGMHYCFDFGGPDTWGCTLVYGHDGDHNSYRAPVTEPGPVSCGWLPGGLSPSCDWSRDCTVHGTGVIPMDDTQVDPAKPLCTYGEDGNGNPNACWKPSGHTGPHMVLDSSPTDD